jgi:GNAT superfamily N-acetyltransferase
MGEMTGVNQTPDENGIHRPASMGAPGGRNNSPFHSPTTPRFDPAGLYFFLNDVLADRALSCRAMPDMLVNLLTLPPVEPLIDGLRAAGIVVRRAQPFELSPVRQFIEKNFALPWADEASVGFANKPISVFIAHREEQILGFAAAECTRRAFFGPTGVLEGERGKGVGKALLIAGLHALRDMGYVYGIIGGVGPSEFYAEAVGATVIPNSTPGIYADRLKKPS